MKGINGLYKIDTSLFDLLVDLPSHRAYPAVDRFDAKIMLNSLLHAMPLRRPQT